MSHSRVPLLELSVFVLVGGVHAWLATYGSFDFFGGERLSVVYDFLGDSLLRFEATVPTNRESLRVDGQDFVYFAPFPALLRIPLNALWPEHFGQWSRVTTLAASLLTVVAWMRLVRVVAPRAGTAARAGLGLAFGLGTPLVYLVSCSYIWHEGIAISLCASIAALVPLARAILLGAATPRSWAAYSACIGVAYLTRLTFGAPHLLIVIWLLGNAVAGATLARRVPALQPLHRSDLAASLKSRRSRAALLGPLSLCIAIFSWYNVERFGNPFIYTSHSSQLIYHADPQLLERHDSIGTFNPRRVPSGLRHYLGDAGTLGEGAPWAHLQRNEDLPEPLYLDAYREWSISLWLVSSWLLAAAMAGAVSLVRERGAVSALIASAFGAQAAVILSYYWVSHRFSAELLPGLSWLAACALFAVAQRRERLPVPVRTLWGATVATSILLTLASTLSWNARLNWGAPDTYRLRLLEAFEAQAEASAPLGQPVPETPPRDLQVPGARNGVGLPKSQP